MVEELIRYNRTISEPMSLKVGIHKGRSIAVALVESRSCQRRILITETNARHRRVLHRSSGGFKYRNCIRSNRSYVIFKAPQIRSGQA